MTKRIKLVDKKMQKAISILGQASEEITGWAEDANQCIITINTTISQVNADVGAEKLTPEDAMMTLEKETTKLFAKLGNRIKRMTRNTKAMGDLLRAVKALDDTEKDQ